METEYMKFADFNKDEDLRDQLLGFPKGRELFGGTRHFDGMTAETLRQLIDLKFADPLDRQNDAPTLGEMLEFITNHPEFTAHGYAVYLPREDYRVTVEGVEGETTDPAEIIHFALMFRDADELEAGEGYQRAWYD